MINYNISGIGQKIRVNFNQDISSASKYTMTIEPERGEPQELTPTLGTVAVVEGDKKFLANEYVEFTITAGLFLDKTDRWRVKATAVIGGNTIATNYHLFRVMP
jgi:hypothetical protein